MFNDDEIQQTIIGNNSKKGDHNAINSGISYSNNGSDSGLNSPDHLTTDEETVSTFGAEKNTPISTCIDRSQSNLEQTGFNRAKIEIVREITSCKEYFGGYRNKVTEQIYHHKASQTIPLYGPIKTTREPTVNKNTRATQTVRAENRSQQTSSSKCTQTTRPGIYISIGSDRTMEPRPYVTADDSIMRAVRQVIVIQKFWRRYKAKKTFEKMVKEKNEKQMLMTTRNPSEWTPVEGEMTFLENVSKQLLENKHIDGKKDFERIYNNLKQWKEEEMTAIESAKLSGKLKQSAFVDLVRKEAQILAIIDERKRNANEVKQERTTYETLKYMTQPKLWKCANKKTYEVVTPLVSKLRKLQNVYYALNGRSNIQERVDVLGSLKEFIKKEEDDDNKLCQEIVQMVDREMELIALRSSPSSISGLHQRIRFLLLEYIFVTYFKENGTLRSTQPIGSSVSQCSSCGQHRPVRNFLSSASVRLLAKCQACRNVDNRSRTKQDYGIYKRHLHWIRKEEERLGRTTGIAFILQEPDICYLVEKIWHRRSALSEVDDPMELVLCHWYYDEEWSPWNCVLLTENEATVHKNMGVVEENYGVVFIQKVKHKQTLGKRYFGRLPDVANYTMKQRLTNQQSLTTNMFITVKPININ